MRHGSAHVRCPESRFVGALAVALILAGCAGTPPRPDPPVAPVWQSHLDRVDASATVVVSVRGLGEVSKDIRATRAWDRVFEFIARRSPGLASLQSTVEGLADVVERDLAGRMTLAFWQRADDGPSRWLLLYEGKMQAAVRAAEQLSREPPGQLVHVGEDVFQYTGFGGGAAEAYVLQRGDLGLMASDRETLLGAQAAAANPLARTLAFGQLVESVDGNGELLLWIGDWTDADDSWSDMANLTPGEALPRAAMVSVSVDAGLRGRYAVEFDPARTDALPLPHLGRATAPLTTPRMLPRATVGFAALQSGDQTLAALAAPALRDAPSDVNVAQELLQGLQGEVAWAVTRAPADAAASSFGFPVPDVAMLAQIREGVDPAQLEPLVAALFRQAHLEIAGTGDMGPPTILRVGDHPIVSFTTADPALEIAYTTFNGFLVVGTRGAVTAVVETAQADPAASLAMGGRDPRAAAALARPWTYVALLDFEASYQFVKSHWGHLLAGVTQGVFGPGDDVLEFLFSVVPAAGVTLGYQGDLMVGEFWIAAQDAR